MKRLLLAGAASIGILALVACENAAIVADRNLDTAAENFEIFRVVSFYNTWGDVVVLQVSGFCNVNDETTKFQVICREEDGTFTRRQMGRSEHLTYFLDQPTGVSVSEFHSRVTFRPQTMIPDIDFQGSAEELITNQNQDG